MRVFRERITVKIQSGIIRSCRGQTNEKNINFRAVNIVRQLPLSINIHHETLLVQQYVFLYEESSGYPTCFTRRLIVGSDRFASRTTLSLRTYIEKRKNNFLRVTDDSIGATDGSTGANRWYINDVSKSLVIIGFSASQMNLGEIERITNRN